MIGVGRGGTALGPIVAVLLFAASFGLDSVSLIMAFGSVVAIVALLFLRVTKA